MVGVRSKGFDLRQMLLLRVDLGGASHSGSSCVAIGVGSSNLRWSDNLGKL